MRCQGLHPGWAFHFTLASNYLVCAHLYQKSSNFSLMHNFTSILQCWRTFHLHSVKEWKSHFKLVFFFCFLFACMVVSEKLPNQVICCQTAVTTGGSIWQIHSINTHSTQRSAALDVHTFNIAHNRLLGLSAYVVWSKEGGGAQVPLEPSSRRSSAFWRSESAPPTGAVTRHRQTVDLS